MPTPQLGWQPQQSDAPVSRRPVHQVGPVAEGGHERDREPVARRLAKADLVLDVVGEVRKRVALRLAPLIGDRLVAAGKGDRLEGKEGDLLGIVQRELNDASNLLVIDAVDDRRDRHDVHSRVVAGFQSRAA